MTSATDPLDVAFISARELDRTGRDEAAKAAYLGILRRDPTHFGALHALGVLALDSGHASAAQTAFLQAVRCHGDNPAGLVSLGNLLFNKGDFLEARDRLQAAVTLDADRPDAHQGLARALAALGETAAAEPHWQKGFAGYAIAPQPYRGTGSAIPILLLVSVRRGNVPTRAILDDKTFAVTALYAEFHDPARLLPPHALVFNAIGDADLCPIALRQAEEVLARTTSPVINAPAQVCLTGREENARRLGMLPGVIAPTIRAVTRTMRHDIETLNFPLLLRAPGFHTGQHFVRVDRPEVVAAAVAIMPDETLLAIEYHNARGTDGMARKYRVMIIDGVLWPMHLAISADWKVHYFTAAMASNAAWREEERRFLDDMPAVLGASAMAALERIGQCLGLEYAGIDFALDPDGAVLVFEANATMVINPPDVDPMWDYRRAPIGRVLDAAKRMVLARVAKSHT